MRMKVFVTVLVLGMLVALAFMALAPKQGTALATTATKPGPELPPADNPKPVPASAKDTEMQPIAASEPARPIVHSRPRPPARSTAVGKTEPPRSTDPRAVALAEELLRLTVDEHIERSRQELEKEGIHVQLNQ
jgi:hypothetical protein